MRKRPATKKDTAGTVSLPLTDSRQLPSHARTNKHPCPQMASERRTYGLASRQNDTCGHYPSERATKVQRRATLAATGSAPELMLRQVDRKH